jgi:hypothetical protein
VTRMAFIVVVLGVIAMVWGLIAWAQALGAVA